MSQSPVVRKKSKKWNLKIHYNKKAFDAVIDAYLTMQSKRSSLPSTDYNDVGKGAVNLAKPSQSDFVCDVQLAIEQTLGSTELIDKFYDEYINGIEHFSQGTKSALEQRVGHVFRVRKIWPIAGSTKGYFTTIRKQRNES